MARIDPSLKISERQIEVFRTLMITRTLSAAARQLFVSQPGLSVTLRRFEEQLGTRLFERMGGRLVPTEEAQRIFEEIERVHGRFGQLIESIQAIARGDNAIFRFGTSPSVSQQLIPQVLARLSAQAGERRFHCDLLGEKAIRDYLWFAQGACVASIADLDDPALARTTVARGRLVCLLPQDDPLAGRPSLAAGELRGRRFISFEMETPHGRIIAASLARSNTRLDVSIYVRVVQLAIAMVRQGLGVAIVDEFSAMGCEALGLKAVPLQRSLPVPVYVYWSGLRPRPRGTDEFIEALRSVAGGRGVQARSRSSPQKPAQPRARSSQAGQLPQP
ncbi:LysR family transcriptional regulator [Hydrogenophaga sp.]|uniref:LysR family transcriptional regulator n=1 Tax=Hydrogenophaga sp. TaxID=1904254 RepID=UPI00263911E7|nr:LysR family transcriptional regulator [Hydrogenophaga sp.]MCW5655640.1 LysR family transcriptional regulator [Hydrogenophaga sp.]